MTQSLVHRGPDDEGYHDDNGASLGHRRLSIVDPTGGHQPIRSEDGSTILICNGEIYNSPELRDRYVRDGYRFRTGSDVEVILPLYLEFGERCVAHLRGMFAFCIWDTRTHVALLARDRLGIKPLYYARQGESLVFASEPKAVLASGVVPPSLNPTALWHYVSLRYVPGTRSLFDGVSKLEAGSTLVHDARGTRTNRYWELSYGSKIAGTDDSIEQELDRRLHDTVAAHLQSDVPVGALLSGGIDSGLMTALAAKHSAQPIPTFSIGVAEHDYNELPYAAMVAQRYGTDHHVEIVAADLIRELPQLVWHMDEPSDPFALGMHLVSRLASQHVKVVLTGDGGDELFAGYDRYVGQRLVEYYRVLPAFFRKAIMRRLIGLIPESMGYKSARNKALWMQEMSFLEGADRYGQSLSFLRFTEAAKKDLFTPEFQRDAGGHDSIDLIRALFDAHSADDVIDQMLYTDLQTRMPDHLLTLVDRMSMAHSLEARPPMLDHEFVEFAARLPVNWKLRGRTLKYGLRRVARRYLDRDLVDRPKQGFGFPLATWFRTSLAPFVERVLTRESRLSNVGITCPDTVSRIVREHTSGRIDHNFRLWILINLEYWHRLHIDGMSLGELEAWTERMRKPDGSQSAVQSNA